MSLRAALLLGLLPWLIACAGRQAAEPAVAVSDGRYRMGTVAEITLPDPDVARARRRIDRVFELLARFDRLFSRHDPESDLSKLNARAGRGPQTVDPDLAEILGRAVEGSRQTDGAFDVTVGPLVALWIEAARSDRIPSAADLAAARRHVGRDAIGLAGDGRVALADSAVSIDLGGIAKGFALDRAVAALREQGVSSALLQIGQSSTWALGAPPGEPGWRLGLRGASGGVEGAVTLRDRALSVSSSLGQWSVIAGRRFGHVVDPRTGQALTRALQAAVVAEDATTAEILSTALVVLSPEEGLALVEARPGVEARWLDDTGQAQRSSGWQALTSERAWPPPPEINSTPHLRDAASLHLQ
ncbi:MAG: FAD:protein FMN transferase [Myxococcota bacterium]